MLAVAIQIDAQDAAGAALPVRVVSHDVPELGHYDGQQWDAALAELPTFALDFFGGGFQGQVTAPTTGFAVATIGLAAFGATPSARARFADARVRIWVGEFPSSSMVLRFDGRLTGEPEIDEAARIARFDAAVNDGWADDPLLDLFAGTGGIEGPADLTGQPKPLVLGNARFCGGVIIDSQDNVWMVSNGPVQAVNAVYDRLASLGTSAGDHADLAALLAATIPNGSWATCLAQGLVRLGAPPDGRVSFDVSGSNAGTGGYVRRAGAMIRRIADLAGGTVNAASLTALDTARPYNLTLQLREQVTPREIIARIADGVAAVAGVSLTGELFAQALTLAGSGEVLNPDGTSALRVASVEELAKAAPAWRLATEAELTFELHSADEAAFSYRWQGEYSATRVYRLDDVVTGPDSAVWAYINAAPAAGQALPVWPTTMNSYWRIFSPPGGAGVTIDANGNIQGIGTGTGTSVDNGRVVLEGVESARPGGGPGLFVGTLFSATDTGSVTRWNGTSWEPSSDITTAAIRTIEPQFPVIEIKQGEAGHTGNRTVTHTVNRGTATLTGGTWSLLNENLGTGDATINSSSGTVTLSGIVQSGAYSVRYTHTDSIPTDLAVNVSYVASAGGGGSANTATSITKPFSTTSFAAASNEMTITLPAGVTQASLIAQSITLTVAAASPIGATNCEAKWQRESSPGTWTDVGSAASSSPSPFVQDEGGGIFSADSGAITCNRTATGLTAGSTQKFRFVARVSSGNTRTVTPFGSVTAGA